MGQLKFGRKYNLSIGTKEGGFISVELPFTIEIDIVRNILSSANICQLRIYNLSELRRNQIRFDYSNYGELRPIILKAGYGSNLPTIFSGNISQAYSVREGVNFITYIECYDGGFAFTNGISSESFPAGTLQSTIYSTLLENLPGVSVGAVGNYEGSISRGNAYDGNTTDLLNNLTGGGFFIDNGKAYCLKDNECLEGELQLINTDTGLLGTPRREQTIVHFDILFEPRLTIGQKIKLESSTDANFNGYYKIISIAHRGVISEAISGEMITSAGFFYGVKELETVGVV